jgi:site-specific DNA-cytosine methylase
VKIKIGEDTDRSARSNVRRLTPLEYWRLMGFDDEDLQKARDSGISDTQLYRQAGNSIVVQCLEGIIAKLLRNKDDIDITEEGQTSWMDYLKLKMDA